MSFYAQLGLNSKKEENGCKSKVSNQPHKIKLCKLVVNNFEWEIRRKLPTT